MPLNTLRLNHQKSSHPNDRIVFIKPLPRPPSDQASYNLADTFLRAVAAQCLPLMKNHYLSVTTLEEYEPNPEFIGRNFNNGEIIQLVLQSKSGEWVPFNMVQMVMMHELAHNTHMNHGRDFWKTRNLYAEEMKRLWEKGYTGTYRSRNRKRKARKDRPELTWKEKRDRRIEKKFGKNGVMLGEDEDVRLSLEINRKGPIGNKPRVAQSKRGRELRAAAALARFETNKKEVEDLQSPGGEAISEIEDEDIYEDADADREDAKDANGQKMLDSQGRGMIRVCDNEDTEDINVQRELQDLNTLNRYFNSFRTDKESKATQAGPADKNTTLLSSMTATSESDTDEDGQASGDREREKQQPWTKVTPTSVSCHLPNSKSMQSTRDASPTLKLRPTTTSAPLGSKTIQSNPDPGSAKVPSSTLPSPSSLSRPATIPCPICSLENPRLNATCVACSHVLDPRKDPRHWSCQSTACKESQSAYLNAGDAGVCGICGTKKAG